MFNNAHSLRQDCNCTTCCMNGVYLTHPIGPTYINGVEVPDANKEIRMESTEGTKFDDMDGEDGCYIDYADLHEKIYKSNLIMLTLQNQGTARPSETSGYYIENGKIWKFDSVGVTNSNSLLQPNSELQSGVGHNVISEFSGVKFEIAENDLYIENGKIRKFDSGATRDTSEGKIDFEGFLSPIVLEEFGKYMLKHQKQSNGELRPSDNWQKGMPRDVYMKSAWRHFHYWWMEHRGYDSREGMKDALNGLLFNLMGYMHELLKEENKSISKPEYKEELFY